MDIIEIHAPSFAARVAQVAAAELCGLLSFGEPVPVIHWYDPAGGTRSPEQAAADIERLADYVCTRDVLLGEQLYRWAIGAGIIAAPPDGWAALPLPTSSAFVQFVATCRGVYRHLDTLQQSAFGRLERETAPPPPALRREDSIFEEVESLGTLRPEAVAAMPMIAGYDKAQREALELEREQKRAAREQEKAAKAAARPAPLSVGEAPARPPVNRGGRGRKKRE